MPIPLVTRILVADDHPIVRSGLRKVLDAQPDLEVVAEAVDGANAVERALAEDVDLAILDVSMPRKTGIQAAAELHKRRPELRVLILSMHDNEQYLFEALKAGASGYVLKSVADRDLVARMQGGRASFETYFGRYGEMTAWHLSAGTIDGRLAAIVTDTAGATTHVIAIDWAGGRIARLRDFYHARYVLEGATMALLA